jgi:protoheme IX farnesyltransferase
MAWDGCSLLFSGQTEDHSIPALCDSLRVLVGSRRTSAGVRTGRDAVRNRASLGRNICRKPIFGTRNGPPDAANRRSGFAGWRLRPEAALMFGLVCSVVAELCFFLFISTLAAALALLVAFSYDLLYTPLKRRSWWSVAVGAVPGALPPVIGWVSAGRSFDGTAGLLFAAGFLWQFPQFHAIAWLCREDYARARICMLPVIERDGRSTARQIILALLALLPVSLLPVWWGTAGPLYGVTALLLGSAYVGFGVIFGRALTTAKVRPLLRASLLYLPLLLGVMALDRNP